MNRVCNFAPEKCLVPLLDEENQTVVDPTTGLVELTLPTDARVEWFNTYCAENNIYGVIDDSEVRFEKMEGSREIPYLCIVTADVYMDGKLVGKSSASTPFYGTGPYDRFIVAATATRAKGRALGNAGFNISKVYSDGDNPLTDKNAAIPLESNASEKQAEAASEPTTAEAPCEVAEEPKSETEGMTLEQAYAVIWPSSRSEFSGKSLREIADTKKGKDRIAIVGKDVDGKWFKKYPDLVTGCRVISAAS